MNDPGALLAVEMNGGGCVVSHIRRCAGWPFVQSKRVGTCQSTSCWRTFQYSIAAVGNCRSSPLAPLAQWLPALSVKLIITITRDTAGDPPSLTCTIAPPLSGTLIVHRPGGSTPIMARYSGSWSHQRRILYEIRDRKTRTSVTGSSELLRSSMSAARPRSSGGSGSSRRGSSPCGSLGIPANHADILSACRLSSRRKRPFRSFRASHSATETAATVPTPDTQVSNGAPLHGAHIAIMVDGTDCPTGQRRIPLMPASKPRSRWRDGLAGHDRRGSEVVAWQVSVRHLPPARRVRRVILMALRGAREEQVPVGQHQVNA